jgi:hypothetical protein
MCASELLVPEHSFVEAEIAVEKFRSSKRKWSGIYQILAE